MNQIVKDKWLAALRSGKYVQGTKLLRRAPYPDFAPGSPDQFCCLGVLCDLAVQEGAADLIQVVDKGVFFYGRQDGGKSTTTLPTAVRTWAGLSSDNPTVHLTEGENLDNLASLNDAGLDFLTIAQLIEEQL